MVEVSGSVGHIRAVVSVTPFENTTAFSSSSHTRHWVWPTGHGFPTPVTLDQQPTKGERREDEDDEEEMAGFPTKSKPLRRRKLVTRFLQ